MTWLDRLLDRLYLRRPKPPLDLSPYEGRWVAVKDDRVIAHGSGTGSVVNLLRKLGSAANGSVIWYHAHPDEVKRWAVMYPSRPGWVCPNCLFDTQDEARRWANSDGDPGYVVTRAGQYDPWLPVEEVSP